MGHIELAAPVSHIWYFKGIPSSMGLILDMSPRALEKVLYFASYIVLDRRRYRIAVQTASDRKENTERLYDKYGNTFEAAMGAEAIKKLLQDIDLEKRIRRAEGTAAGHHRAEARAYYQEVWR